MQIKKVGKISSVLTVMYKELFQANKDFVQRSKMDIAELQYTLLKTPNYFYLGKIQIIDQAYSIPPLDRSLHKKANAYIEAATLYTEHTKLFAAYLATISNTIRVETDLYWLLPKTLHKYLTEISKADEQPDYIESIRPANYGDIELIVAEQLMFSLLE